MEEEKQKCCGEMELLDEILTAETDGGYYIKKSIYQCPICKKVRIVRNYR